MNKEETPLLLVARRPWALAEACAGICLSMILLGRTTVNALGPGDTGNFPFPVYNLIGSTLTLKGIQLTPSNVPSWFIVDSANSQLGPLDVSSGSVVTLHLNYVLGPDYTANSTMSMNLLITSSSGAASGFYPTSMTWTITSNTGLNTYRMTCVDNTGVSCGSEVAPDTTPPVTRIDVHHPKSVDSQGRVFISTATPIILEPYDNSVPDAVVSGLAFVGIATDTIVSSTAALSSYNDKAFTFLEGIHTITVASEDNAGLWETIHSSTVYVDATPPVTQISVQGPTTIDAQGNVVYGTGSYVSLVATDPLSNGVTSGVKAIKFSIDGSSFSVFQSTFTPSAGFHTIVYYAVDNVGNAESQHQFQGFFGQGAPVAGWSTFAHDSHHSARISGLGPSLPKTAWTMNGLGASPLAIGPDGAIYAVNSFVSHNLHQTALVALNADGSTRWSYSGTSLNVLFEDAATQAPAIGSDGTVYASAQADCQVALPCNSAVVALSPNGILKWKVLTPTPYGSGTGGFGPPTLGLDGTIYSANTVDGNLYAISNAGNVLWKAPIGGYPQLAPPAIGLDGAIYASGASPGQLTAVNPNGSLRWSIATAGNYTFQPAVRQDGAILIGSDSYLQAVSSGTGAALWTFDARTISPAASFAEATPAFGPDGTAYFHDAWTDIVALNPNGTLRWKFSDGIDRFSGAFTAADSQGNVFVASMFRTTGGPGTLFAFTAGGNLIWSMPLADNPGSMAMGEDGSIFLHGANLVKIVQRPVPNQITLAANPNPVISGQPTLVTATVLDSANNPVSGVTVAFSVGNGSGAFISTSAVTNANGAASSTFTTSVNGLAETVQASYANLTGSAIVNKTFGGPAAGSWSLYFHDAQHTGRISGVGPSLPISSWTVSGSFGGQPTIGPDGAVYTLEGGNLVAFNPDGSTRWSFPAASYYLNTGEFASPALSATGVIYANSNVSSGESLVAISPTGTLNWALQIPTPGVPAGDAGFGPVSIGLSGTIYSESSPDRKLYAVSPYGTVQWAMSLSTGFPEGYPPVTGQDGTIYAVTSNPGVLYAISPNGAIRWMSQTAGVHAYTPSIRPDGAILIASDAYLQGFNSATGAVLWTLNVASIDPFASQIFSNPSIGPDGTAYISDGFSKLLAVSPNGQLRWQFDDGVHRVASGAFPILDSQGNIFVVENTIQGASSIFAFNANGVNTWTFPLSDNVESLSMGENGTLFTSGGVALHAIGSLSRAASSDGVVSLTSNQSGISIVAVSSASPQYSFALASATANGLELISNVYQITHSTFSPPAQISFQFNPSVVTDTSTLAIYRFDGVSWSSTSATGITNQVVADSTSAQVTANIAYASLWALFTKPGDIQPPRTSLLVGSPRYSASPIYISSTTPLSLQAVDDKLAVGDGIGLGVARTFLAIDTATFSLYTGTFTLVSQGTHTIQFYSIDVVGNAEAVHSTQVAVDVTAPVVQLSITGSSATVNGGLFIAATSSVAISAQDPVVGSVASGLGEIQLSVDGTTQAYTAPFTLAAGSHTLAYGAFDNLGNGRGVLSTAAISVDGLPPRTAVAFSTPSFQGPELFLISASSITFSAADDLAQIPDARGSGVAQTLWSLDSGAFVPIAGSTEILTEGLHGLSWYSRDLVGNTEVARSTTVAIDDTPPLTQIAISSPQVQQPSGLVVGPQTVFALAAQDPVSNGVASGVSRTLVAVATASFSTYASSFTVSGLDGSRLIQFYSLDNVGNAEVAKSTTVLLDVTPPQTALSVAGGQTFGLYVSSAADIALSAVDPIVSGVSAGVASTRYQDNGGVLQIYVSSFSLAEGAHALAYQSQDNVGNLEVPRSTTVLVDATPPMTTVSIGSPSFTSSGGVLYVTPTTPIILSAADPALPQLSSGPATAGSGVAMVMVSIDSAPFAVYTTSLTFAEGAHTLAYRSIDNVGNAEAVRVLSLQSDATAPVTALAVSSPTHNGFVSSATLFTLSAVDPVVSGVASGVALTRYQINGGAFISSSAAFGLVGPDGLYTVNYQSVDNVGNTEVLKSTTVILDQTPPVTTTHVGLSSYTATGGTLYVTPSTPVTFTAVDPSSGTPASGLSQIQVAVDSGSFTLYTATLTFAEGAHTVLYRAVDNVGNVEAAHTMALQSDATPPVTTLLASGNFYASTGQNYAPVTFSYGLTAQDPVSNGVASGVDFTLFRVYPASFSVYASTFGLTEGARRVDFQSQDNLGNLELLKSATIFVDATPPVSSLVIGQPSFTVSSATVLVSSLTPIAVAAVDPTSNGVASGVRQSLYSVAGGSFTVSSASFTLSGPQGPRTIGFYSVDNVGNAEAAKSSTVLLVPMPPQITLAAPNTGDQGIGRVFKGRFPVLGSVADQFLKSWVLDFAPGQNATGAFTVISSGTVNVSSATLGVWDTTALSGWQTLRLTAVDLVNNAANVTLNVFVGDPGQLMILGNDDVFNLPQGVAIGPNGNIYVADTNDDRIAVFSSTGAPLASFGQPGRDGDDLRLSTSTVKLNQPRGVAVDASGDILIADSLDNRVLELSATGQVLLTLGLQKKCHGDGSHDDGDPGTAAGEFNRPSGVALDISGRIYVSDTLNSRVQVFSSTGAFLLAFSLPPLPTAHDGHQDRDDKAAVYKNLGRPYGIALDAAGRVYVADPTGGRALVFGATGQLLLSESIGSADGHGHSEIGRPLGIAASAAGDFFLVSDSRHDQVLKFDALGDLTLTFGQRFRDGPRGSTPGIFFHKPAGLALDASGDLIVADRNRDRIKEFSLPNGQPTLVTPSAAPGSDDEAVAILDQEIGGAVQRSDNAGIDVPSGALPDDLKITVATASAASLSQASSQNNAIQSQGIMPAYAPVEYQPEGTRFDKPVTLTLPYDPALLASLNVSPQSLQVHYWNPKTQQWQAFDSKVDAGNHTVTAQTTHFSLYQVMIGSAAVQAIQPQAASNTVSTIQVACNPLRPSCQPLNFRNLPAGARLRIYTLAGALVKDMATDGSGTATWDGTNQSGQPAASGVYFVFAQGAGESKTIKIAVER